MEISRHNNTRVLFKRCIYIGDVQCIITGYIVQKKKIQQTIANFEDGKVTRFAIIHPEDGHSNIVYPKPKLEKEEPLIQGT